MAFHPFLLSSFLLSSSSSFSFFFHFSSASVLPKSSRRNHSLARKVYQMGRNLRSNAAKKTEFEDVPIEPLSGKPFFDIVISKKKPLFQMVFPPRMYSELPNGTVEAVIMHGKNTWKTTLYGNKSKKNLDTQTWRHFLDDTNLGFGDGLILEVMESSQVLVKFKAQILRGDFPAELDAQISGGTLENAITID